MADDGVILPQLMFSSHLMVDYSHLLGTKCFEFSWWWISLTREGRSVRVELMADDGVILPQLQFSPQLMVECSLFVLLQCAHLYHSYKCCKIIKSKSSPDTLVTQQVGVLSVLAQLCFEGKSGVYPWFLVIVCLLFATHNSLCCLHAAYFF